MTTYTAVNSKIVHSVDFEAGIVKILEGSEGRLSKEEAEAVKLFKKPPSQAGCKRRSNSLKEKLQSVTAMTEPTANSSQYIDLNFIPCTSNSVERLFSRAKILLGTFRHRLLPSSLEQQLFLLSNRNLWDVDLIEKILKDTPDIIEDEVITDDEFE
ncbi:hypothetical protein RCL1_001738 [Eukaryota sp. TZLM3-RCL]